MAATPESTAPQRWWFRYPITTLLIVIGLALSVHIALYSYCTSWHSWRRTTFDAAKWRASDADERGLMVFDLLGLPRDDDLGNRPIPDLFVGKTKDDVLQLLDQPDYCETGSAVEVVSETTELSESPWWFWNVGMLGRRGLLAAPGNLVIKFDTTDTVKEVSLDRRPWHIVGLDPSNEPTGD